MNSIAARLLLTSIVFLLPLIAAAQTGESDDSVTLTAHDPETGDALPTRDGKASIEGTPGDGVLDKYNYTVVIRIPEEWEPGSLHLTVLLMDDENRERLVMGSENFGEIPRPYIGEDWVRITGAIDLSSDTELGQVLRYLGRIDFPSGRAATFEHDVTVGCICPRAGSWTASNYPGTMVCTGIGNLTVPFGANTQTGTLEVANGCQSLLATNFDNADMPMQRVPGECGYEGEAEGTPMVISFTLDVHTEELMTGSLRSEIVQGGTTCITTRDVEIRFND